MNKHIKNIVLSAMFIGIGIVLPFLTGQVKQIGNMLLPMHIPVFLCGLICGWQYGLIVGIILPLFRSAVFGMPVMYPNAVAMAFELGAYGFFSGLIYSLSKRKSVGAVYRSVIIAMLTGRVVWGIVQWILLGMGGFTLKMFLYGAFVNAVPGIAVQLILIPAVVTNLKR